MQLSGSDSQQTEQNVQSMGLPFGLHENHTMIVERTTDERRQNRLTFALLVLANANKLLAQIEGNRLIRVDEDLDGFV